MSAVEVVVVGGGFAGLSAAVHLAARGTHVCLIEQDDAPGGKAGEIRAGGFRFDTGPSVFTLPSVFEEVFAAAGRPSPLRLEPLDLLCRYRFPSGRVWDVYHDVDRTIAQLSAREADAYVGLLHEARRLYEAAAPTFVFGPAPGPLDLARYGVRHGLRAHPHRRLPDLLRAFGAEGDLETFFLRFATYFGADPYRAPAVLHNIAWVELGLGVAYPEGGIRAAVDALADLARDLGVDLRTGTKATGLTVSDGRVMRVETSAGPIEPTYVIAATDRAHTLELLGRTVPRGAATSLSGFVVLLGVRGVQPRLAHHTIAFPPDYREEFDAVRAGRFPVDPTLYFHVSSRIDSTAAPPGAENWFVMTNAPSLPGVADDPGPRARDREREYAGALEAKLHRDGFLDGMDVAVRRWRGPSDLARYGHRGAIYGRAPHSLSATLRPPQRLAGLDNLALASGTVHPGGGIPLALLSGRQAARVAHEALVR